MPFLFHYYCKGLNDENCQNTESYLNAALRSLLDSLPKVRYLTGSKVFLKGAFSWLAVLASVFIVKKFLNIS